MSNNIVPFKLAKYRDVEDMLAGRGIADGKDITRRWVINFRLFYNLGLSNAVPVSNSRREANQKQIFREGLPVNQALCDKLESFTV